MLDVLCVCYVDQTFGKLVQLPKGVYCLDNDRDELKPCLAVGAACSIYLLKLTT